MTDPPVPVAAADRTPSDREPKMTDPKAPKASTDFPSIIGPVMYQRIIDDLQRGPFGLEFGGPYRKVKLTRRDRIRFRIQGWRWSMRERLHDRLFPSCRHGEWW